ATFSTRPGQVVAVVAGLDAPTAEAREAAEDDGPAGRRAVEQLGVSAADAVVGVSASGRTPYALGALEAAPRAPGPPRRPRLGATLATCSSRRPRADGGRRPGGRLRLDAFEGRHGAETRPEHDLHRRDDPARQDLRRPDGRRARVEREARGPGATGRARSHR